MKKRKRKKKKPEEDEQLTFNLPWGEAAKEEGMAQARESDRRKEALAEGRWAAKKIACSRPERTVTADDVQRHLIKSGYTPDELGPAAGSLFREKEDGKPLWKWTGELVKSERVSNHASLRPVWEFVGEAPKNGEEPSFIFEPESDIV